MCKAPHFHIGYCQFGAMELRAVLSGGLVFVGISYGAVPGESLKDKRAFLAQVPADELQAIVKSDGWIVEILAGSFILIPRDVLLCKCVLQSSHSVSIGLLRQTTRIG